MTDVKISEQRLKELERLAFKMECLIAGGVDNWEWYGESLNPYFLKEEENEKLDKFFDELLESLASCAYEPGEQGEGHAFHSDGQNEAFSMLKEFLQESYKFVSKENNDD